MRPHERYVFDYATNAWVLAGAFNERAVGHEMLPLDAPASAPREGVWNRPAPMERPRSPMVALLAWLAVSSVVTALAIRNTVPMTMATVILAVAYAVIESRKLKGSLITDADRMLLEDPDDPDVCLVGLTVVRNGNDVGTDKGVAWFADGLLLYSGHRTSFAIGGEDVLPEGQTRFVPTLLDAGLGERDLALRVGGGTAYISLQPLIRNGPQEMRFLKRLYAFRRRPPQSRGPRQWPPF